MENKEKIDILIDKNTAEQLSQVDWEKMNASISNRLDNIRRQETLLRKFPTLLKAAATIAAVATVIIAVTLYIEKPLRTKLNNGGTAEVEFVKSKGSTLVEIQPASVDSLVTVDIETKGILAECDVEILETTGGFEENTAGPTWIIISRPQSLYAENGTNRDMMDIMYLF